MNMNSIILEGTAMQLQCDRIDEDSAILSFNLLYRIRTGEVTRETCAVPVQHQHTNAVTLYNKMIQNPFVRVVGRLYATITTRIISDHIELIKHNPLEEQRHE